MKIKLPIGTIRKRRRSPEAEIQSAFFCWMGSKYPKLRPICFAIPNGGSRHPLEAKNLRLQGVTAGIPDVFIPVAKKSHHGLFLEFKSKNGKLTPLQSQKIDLLRGQGYQVEVCYEFDQAVNIFTNYMDDQNKNGMNFRHSSVFGVSTKFKNLEWK